MAYLNQQQRDALRNELLDLKFPRAKGKVRRMDDKSRLVYLRNAQMSGQISTRYELPTLGVMVTWVEKSEPTPTKKEGILKQNYELLDVVVEPTAANTR